MAEDFSKLTAAIDTVTSEITTVVVQLKNPAVDNNNQSTIDALTAKLTDAAAALGAAIPTPSAGPTPADGSTSGDAAALGAAIPTPSAGPTPADGSTSGDVTA